MIKFIFFTYRVLFPARYGACRYIPTCSQYMEEAIEKHGIVIGILKGLRRLFSCNPLSTKEIFDPLK